MKTSLYINIVFFFCLTSFATHLTAPTPAFSAEKKQKPLWEAGIAGGGGYTADYPAASQNHSHGIAVPYVVYRGKTLRIGDGKGIVRGRFISNEQLELDLSLSGSFSTESSDNDARQGMTDLDHLAEVGPRMQYTLAKFGNNSKFDVEIPVRAIFSSDFSSLHYRGFVSQPEIAFQQKNLLNTGIKFKLSAGPIFASQDFMNYLYEVPGHYATSTRKAFSAEGGYLGSKVKVGFAKQLTPRMKLFGMAHVGYYGDAKNGESPLHVDDLNFNVGMGFVWSLWQSQKTTTD